MAEPERNPQQLAFGLLPDLPGKVHGIVQLEPFVRIQCDGCGFIHDGKPGKIATGIILSGIYFHHRRYRSAIDQDRRRLCRSCRSVEWPDFQS